jgi:cobalt-zinc-cadmium efflux system outer membrane protein
MEEAPPPGIEKAPEKLTVPTDLPGAEAGIIERPMDDAKKKAHYQRIYPALPNLPKEPEAQPGPVGKPYTLAALQQLAAANSATLREAAAGVAIARGNLIQAGAYKNPTLSYIVAPSNNGSTGGVVGVGVDQSISTGGKLKLQIAAAQKDLENAELALAKARNDLATQVRNAYFGVLVAKEQVRVNKALARFTDDIYRLQIDMTINGFAAPYEPAALRGQAFAARLALEQAIATYIYNWRILAAVIGMRELPLSAIEGHVDRTIPYFDYDEVRAYVLSHHTDLITARNGIEKARYNLRLAQVTPAFPDVDVNFSLQKDTALPPFGTAAVVTVGVPLALWDRNKGNIIAAQGAYVQAEQEPRRLELALSNNLATQFEGYKTNLDALEYYRRYILPDQVRAFRGVYARRNLDPTVAFADVIGAQQTLSASIATYLNILSQLWTSVVGVADLMQTDDLFQLAKPHPLPLLPELDNLPRYDYSQWFPRAHDRGNQP